MRFLDASRARAIAFARANPKAAFAYLALTPGMSVLDCGCGTGDMLALIAAEVAPGLARGGDFSITMVEEARHRHIAASAANLSFEPMDVQALAAPDQSIDRVLATQLLVHVPDPRRALSEMCRITAPGGMIALSDMDWDSLLIACANKELGRRFTRLFCDGIRNGLVVRECAGWLRAEGFASVQTTGMCMLFPEWSFVRDWIMKPSLPGFVARGTMTAPEAQSLMDDLETRSAAGQFFAAATSYTITARRE